MKFLAIFLLVLISIQAFRTNLQTRTDLETEHGKRGGRGGGRGGRGRGSQGGSDSDDDLSEFEDQRECRRDLETCLDREQRRLDRCEARVVKGYTSWHDSHAERYHKYLDGIKQARAEEDAVPESEGEALAILATPKDHTYDSIAAGMNYISEHKIEDYKRGKRAAHRAGQIAERVAKCESHRLNVGVMKVKLGVNGAVDQLSTYWPQIQAAYDQYKDQFGAIAGSVMQGLQPYIDQATSIIQGIQNGSTQISL